MKKLSFSQKARNDDRKKAITMMKALIRRIERDEIDVTSYGFYQGLPGNWILRVSVKEPNNSEE